MKAHRPSQKLEVLEKVKARKARKKMRARRHVKNEFTQGGKARRRQAR